MTTIRPQTKAGPPGRASLSPVLMRRPGLGDPRQRSNADLLATNARTARGVDALVLDYTAVPSGTQEQLEIVVAKLNELIDNMRTRGLMENTP